MQTGENSPESVAGPRVVAVVVTYDRRDLLVRTLRGIAGGARSPQAVVVVDNASTDGTSEWLDLLAERHRTVDLPESAGETGPDRDAEGPLVAPGCDLDVVHLRRNTGGAGGFAVGIDRALALHEADLVWVMDDDTEPLPAALEEAVRAWSDYARSPEHRPAFVASRVLWTDGREHPMNSMRERLFPGRRRRRAAAAVGARTIRSGSFVSLLMDADLMRRTGLPLADYFIWNDDFEYSTRLARFRDAIQVPSSVVAHHTRTFGTTDADPGPRFYFDVRNKLWVFTRSHSLAGWEKLLYSGATARLWLRSFRNSSDPAVLLDGLRRGVRDALAAPRSTEQVLEGVYDLVSHRTPEETRPTVENPGPEAQDEGGADDDPAFSLLMPVYHGDRPEQLRAALRSNVRDQQLRPAQVVLSLDGPLGHDLDVVVAQFEAQARAAGIDVVVLPHPEHWGLPVTLNDGLRACRHRVVARADADDLSAPERFRLQVPLVVRGAYAVLGSAMLESDAAGSVVEAVRAVATDPEAIARAARLRNPMNHPTVVFDADVVRRAGGYEEIPGAEDYALWLRLLARGERLGNLAQPLVTYRAGRETWRRRGGLPALGRELVLQRRLRAAGYLGPGEYVRNVLVRGGYRLIPTSLRIRAFRSLIGSPRRSQSRPRNAATAESEQQA